MTTLAPGMYLVGRVDSQGEPFFVKVRDTRPDGEVLADALAGRRIPDGCLEVVHNPDVTHLVDQAKIGVGWRWERMEIPDTVPKVWPKDTADRKEPGHD